MIKKTLLCCCTALFCVFLLFGCNDATNEITKQESYCEFTDDGGNAVVLSEKPGKTAVLFSSYSEMTLLAGGNVDVTVGESVERGFVGNDTFLVDSGAGKTVNYELLLASKPDFVIGSCDIAAHVDTAKLLKQAGIPVALFKVESFEDYKRVMKILCDVYDSDESYKKNVEDVEAQIEKVLSRVPDGEKKEILFVRCASSASATKAKTKEDNFVCGMLYQMNTYNIAENAPVLTDGLSIEEILVQQPEYIFFSVMGNEKAAKEYMTGVLNSREWQSLDCVKNKNYAFLPKDLFQYKPNNRWGEAYQYLWELLYDESKGN